MGDENFAPLNGCSLFKASDDGEWENVGYVDEGGISLSAYGYDELEAWSNKLVELSNEPMTIVLKPQWWSLNKFYKLVTGRYRYTVRSLRRWNKGHRRNR